jgi:6-phosphogluconolactonase (cycloisomerase 2 family)
VVDPVAGKNFVYVANYLGNSVSVYSFDPTTGALAIVQTSIPTRTGPISIALDPSGSHAYVANAISGDVSVYSIDPTTGALTAVPADGVAGHATYLSTQGTTPNSVVVDPNDQHLYVTNRGVSNSISIFSIDSATGGLIATSTATAHVTTDYPVSIAIDPTGANVYVVNGGNNTVSFYTASGGGLAFQSSAPAGTNPISIAIDSTGQYAYVANSGSNDISAYSIASTGTLSHIDCTGSSCTAGANFPAGASPSSVTTSQ